MSRSFLIATGYWHYRTSVRTSVHNGRTVVLTTWHGHNFVKSIQVSPLGLETSFVIIWWMEKFAHSRRQRVSAEIVMTLIVKVMLTFEAEIHVHVAQSPLRGRYVGRRVEQSRRVVTIGWHVNRFIASPLGRLGGVDGTGVVGVHMLSWTRSGVNHVSINGSILNWGTQGWGRNVALGFRDIGRWQPVYFLWSHCNMLRFCRIAVIFPTTTNGIFGGLGPGLIFGMSLIVNIMISWRCFARLALSSLKTDETNDKNGYEDEERSSAGEDKIEFNFTQASEPVGPSIEHVVILISRPWRCQVSAKLANLNN